MDYGVPYDFESIMHYPFTAFSKNGKPTISNKVPMNGKVPYVELSDGDAQQTNAMYKCNGKVLHYTASSQDKLSLSEWVEEAWNWAPKSGEFFTCEFMRTSLTGEVTPSNSPRRTVNEAMIIYSNNNAQVENLDHYSFPGSCPPTPPLSQHFALSEKWVLMLA